MKHGNEHLRDERERNKGKSTRERTRHAEIRITGVDYGSRLRESILQPPLENKTNRKLDKVLCQKYCMLLQNRTKYICTRSILQAKFQRISKANDAHFRAFAPCGGCFRRRVRRRSLQPPLAVAATSPFPSIRLLASCWASCSKNDTKPLGAFHGSRSVPRPPRHCVCPRSRATGCPVAVAVGAARNL